MCGIIYSQAFDGLPVNELVFDQYFDQRSRGHEGFGLFNGKHLVHAAEESRIINWLSKKKNESDMLLFHHRFPTSTINVRKAAHPFTTKDYFGDTEYVLIHNGVISNPKDLRTAHEALGITYHSVLDNGTFNDSEALAWDFALTMEGKQDKLKAYGGIAFIAMKLVKGVPTNLYFGRNSRPLKMFRNKSVMLLASEGPGEEVESDQLYNFNYKLKRLTHKYFKVPSYNPDYAVQKWDNRWNSHAEYHSPPTIGGDGQYHYYGTGYVDPHGIWYYYPDNEDYADASDFPVPKRTASDPLGYGVATKISDVLRQRYGSQLDQPEDDLSAEFIEEFGEEYVYDFEQELWVPRTDHDEEPTLFKDKLTEDEIERVLYDSADTPTNKQIQDTAFAYMTASNGVFEDAVNLILDDLDDLMTHRLTQERVNQQLRLEVAQQFIENDPEFLSAESISSMYEAPHHA